MTLEEFLAQMQSDVRAQAGDAGATGGKAAAEAAFTDIVMQHMAEIGMTFDPQLLRVECRVGNAILRLSGYAISDDAEQLDLFVSAYEGLDTIEQIPNSDITNAAEQCLRFLTKTVEGRFPEANGADDPALELIVTVRDCYSSLDQIRVYVLTDRRAQSRSFRPREIAGKLVRLEVVDIERLFRHWSEGKPRDELIVNFEEVCGAALPCVYVPGESEDCDYALTAIPGAALRLIYERYGARLLEANVRSFLSQTGKVNRGMRDTLRDAPERFMAYNNGIVLIADDVALSRTPDGSVGIASLSGMQIVNGGQTTASIYFTKRRERDIDLSRVRVPAKIVIMRAQDPAAEEALISDISRFANTQNAVKISDLSANKPFHVELEKLSLSTWLPDGDGRWFYERAAGSYNVMLAREGTTPARLRALKEAVPPARKITKTDLARYLNAWAGRPHIVSLGLQKNFERFMDGLTPNDVEALDGKAFRGMIAQAILFKAVQRIVKAGSYPAFQVNISTYTVAVLSMLVGELFSLEAVWRRQILSPELTDWLRTLAAAVDEALRRSAGPRMLSEWAKKEECWAELRELDWPKSPLTIPEIQS